jgi:hypothetical protein
MTYPRSFIRGIRDESYVDGDEILPHLFQFTNKLGNTKSDFYEESINWYKNEDDNDEALRHVFNQLKDDRIQFRFGAAIYSTEEMNKLQKHHWLRDIFNWNEDPTDTNDFHGNLFFHRSGKTHHRRLLTHRLAADCFIRIERRPADG